MSAERLCVVFDFGAVAGSGPFEQRSRIAGRPLIREDVHRRDESAAT